MGNKKGFPNAIAVTYLPKIVAISGGKIYPQIRPSSWKLKYMHDACIVASLSLRDSLLHPSESLK